MESNFAFLENHFPALAKMGRLAESYIYSDPNSAIFKIGLIGETMVKLVFNYEKLPIPINNIHMNRINVLLNEGYIPQDICNILHLIRKARNDSSHENYDSVDDAKPLLEMAYSLCEWFMQVYGDWEYVSRPFVMPTEEPTVQIEETGPSEEELIEQAEAVADAAPVVDRKKARTIANQRVKTEAETRMLIDHQLRDVGWEADTNVLRYSKGTRPQKGHNMAIAEWPTNSAVGTGFVDYALFISNSRVGA